jgi:hypothetical protein
MSHQLRLHLASILRGSLLYCPLRMHKWDPSIVKLPDVPHGTVFTFVRISSARILDADAAPRISEKRLARILLLLSRYGKEGRPNWFKNVASFKANSRAARHSMFNSVSSRQL